MENMQVVPQAPLAALFSPGSQVVPGKSVTVSQTASDVESAFARLLGGVFPPEMNLTGVLVKADDAETSGEALPVKAGKREATEEADLSDKIKTESKGAETEVPVLVTVEQLPVLMAMQGFNTPEPTVMPESKAEPLQPVSATLEALPAVPAMQDQPVARGLDQAVGNGIATAAAKMPEWASSPLINQVEKTAPLPAQKEKVANIEAEPVPAQSAVETLAVQADIAPSSAKTLPVSANGSSESQPGSFSAAVKATPPEQSRSTITDNNPGLGQAIQQAKVATADDAAQPTAIADKAASSGIEKPNVVVSQVKTAEVEAAKPDTATAVAEKPLQVQVARVEPENVAVTKPVLPEQNANAAKAVTEAKSLQSQQSDPYPAMAVHAQGKAVTKARDAKPAPEASMEKAEVHVATENLQDQPEVIVTEKVSLSGQFQGGADHGKSDSHEGTTGNQFHGVMLDTMKKEVPAEPQQKAEIPASTTESVLSQVKDHLALNEPKAGKQITLTLNPAELGELKINVTL